jgi:hypothetical protein
MLFAGHDTTINSLITNKLKSDAHFRKQIADLLANKPVKIEIEDEMSYEPSVAFVYFLSCANHRD